MIRLRDFFYFNRSDRGALLFFLLIGIAGTALFFWLEGSVETTPLTTADSVSVDRVPSDGYADRSYRYADEGGSYYAQDDAVEAERFPFDPNTADSTTLLRLGLRPWQVRNIYKYRAAGGVYRRPSDFARLYGLTRKQYRELESYIRISSDYAPAADLFARKESQTADTTHRYSPKLQPDERMPLNESDTASLQRVPGIGSYFARRIVSYRDRLGGYYTVSQLMEIEDFPEKALSFFTVSNNIRRFCVNKLTLNELKRHPYINYYQAKVITDYRRLRGPLKSLEVLRLLREFTSKDIERLRPYIDFNE